MHLLQFGEIDGKYFLKPAISFLLCRSAFSLLATSQTAQLQYFDPEDRDPIQCQRYREERPSTDLTSPGLFGGREVLVREVTIETDPIEQLDMTAFCTSREHAVDVAKFLVRMRRVPTHTITLKPHRPVAALMPGDYIKVAMDETEYDEFNNGVVTPEGALVSTKTLTNGTYDVVAWGGTEGTPPADATLAVSGNGKTASPAGIVFTVKLPSTQVRVYQVERISPTENGTFTKAYMPVNDSGILQLPMILTCRNWTIQS